MFVGPALIAEIPPARKRASPVSRGENAVFSSCNRFDRAGKRVVFAKSSAQSTAQGG